MDRFILALDQGTTSSRAVVFNKKGEIVSSAQKEFTQHFPKAGWVEHSAEEIWDGQFAMAQKALYKNNIDGSDIAGIGIANQRETVVVWEKATGKPVYPAIVWQDKRTADYCQQLRDAGKTELIRNKTGLVIDAYFSASKVKWILDNVKGVRDKAEIGQLKFGTIDSWLIWKLTDGAGHFTDVSNASRTMLFNIHTMSWDEELLELFTIPASMLPEVKSSSEIYAHTADGLFTRQIPICGIAGDQQAALFGQMCVKPGMVKNTYGTGCFMLMNIGDEAVISKSDLLTTVAWQINGKTTYALEGSVFIAGAVVQWLRDGLKFIQHSDEIEQLAGSVESSDGVYFVPSFAGLGAPYWNQEARGTIFGLTRGSTNAHIARAAVESIAFQTLDILKAMESDTGIAITELRVDGGGSVNDFLMQFQADVLQANVIRPGIVETTALGAAFLAGLAVNYWKDQNDIFEIWKVDRRFEPAEDGLAIEQAIAGWYRAINTVKYWSENK